jgi:deoxyribodipyrimidine photo-lyase
MKRKMGPMILRIGWFELLWRDFVYVQKNTKTKFFLYAGIKGEKENSQSLSNKLFSQWENGATPSDFTMLIW